MFGNRYFGPRYFGDRYFGQGDSGTPLSVVTTSLPSGINGESYTTTLAATGGTPAYTWSVTVGSLPAWASLDAGTGVISGTVSGAATTSFTVRVTDAASATADQPLSITTSALTAIGASRGGAASLIAIGGM